MQKTVKITFLFLVFSFISCDDFFISLKKELSTNLFSSDVSTEESHLSSRDKTKELVQEEALESAKKATWEVSLYLNFQKKEVSFLKNQVNITSSQELIHLGHGSGFFISPRLMITNFHVIDSANDHIEIISNQDSEDSTQLTINKMKLLKISSSYDLALLKSENKSSHFLNVREKAIDKIKDSFFLLAYPENRFILSEIHYNSSQFNRKLLLFDRKQELGKLTGASGGPIIDQKGELVAVNQSGSDKVSIGISHFILERFLEGDHRDCSESSLEDCLNEEWNHLYQSYKKGDQMAQYRMSVNKSYEHWLNKREKLNQLIKQRETLNQIAEELAEKLELFKNKPTVENKNSYEQISKHYDTQVSNYNNIVSELNQLLF